MRESDIRSALRASLAAEHAAEPDTVIVDELGVCRGFARVDMAVVNGSLNGYEIKSERDKLVRLPRQRDSYGRCFDTMTLVASSNHIRAARSIIPKWWGILRPVASEGGVGFVWVRRPKVNNGLCAESLVQLLWREEALTILTQVGLAPGPRSRTRRELWTALQDSVPLDSLKDHVRAAIKARGDWRSGESPFRRDDSSRSSAKSQRSRANRQWLLSRGSSRPHN
jgi:hypothetical protein